VPVIAISGSNGKTTTKEMLAHILSGSMTVFKSPGNFNNHIGVPLTVLGAPDESDVLIIELGSNHRGEIAKLTQIARPHIGVLTNVGRAHIGFFGSVEEIAREKSDVLRHLVPGGRGVINAEGCVLGGALTDIDADIITFAVKREANFRAAGVKQLPGGGSTFTVAGHEVKMTVPGLHNVYNALAAIAAASLLEVEVGDSARALESFGPVRVKTISGSSITIMDDSYNANPDSVRAAADILSGARARRRIFILGEMLELGSESEQLHREVGSMLAASGIDMLIGIGGQTRSAVEEALASGMDAGSAFFFETRADAKRYIGDAVLAGDVILVKGSRLAGLEEICEFLRSTVEGRA
jgi:UDP-N-acetylmuramoyl-tripeptide--D-alanyl-D-alanine ligase